MRKFFAVLAVLVFAFSVSLSAQVTQTSSVDFELREFDVEEPVGDPIVTATVTAAVLRLIPSRKNGTPPALPVEPLVTEKLCDERSGNIQARLDRMNTYLQETKSEILAAIKKNGN